MYRHPGMAILLGTNQLNWGKKVLAGNSTGRAGTGKRYRAGTGKRYQSGWYRYPGTRHPGMAILLGTGTRVPGTCRIPNEFGKKKVLAGNSTGRKQYRPVKSMSLRVHLVHVKSGTRVPYFTYTMCLSGTCNPCALKPCLFTRVGTLPTKNS